MPNNYVLLETIALTQSAASVTFDNLPTSGYTDLKIVASTRWSNTGPDGFYISFNGSTASFTSKILEGSGSAASSSSPARLAGGLEGTGYTANTFGSSEIYIPNYRSSNFKSYSADAVTENNATQAFSQLIAGLWSNTAAITSIGLAPTTGSFVANSTFSLYGIAAYGTTPVTAPKATGGNIVANDGTYWYHAFTSSGNFVPQVGLTADILQIAGGGGGGGYTQDAGGSGQLRGSAGGAGGLLAFTNQALVASTNYNVTVGAGGASTTGAAGGVARNGNPGNPSQFASLTASVGGGRGVGGFSSVQTSRDGGSGGGGMSGSAGGSPTSGQGFAGGAGDGSFSGGGGGAGAAGQAAVFLSYQGNGGVGSSAYSSWGAATNTGQLSGGTYYYAGGGSNATAGLGGGSTANVNATANTGGGGGGDNNLSGGFSSGAGGSGIIIIRYPIA